MFANLKVKNRKFKCTISVLQNVIRSLKRELVSMKCQYHFIHIILAVIYMGKLPIIIGACVGMGVFRVASREQKGVLV